jgi:hypothetical protein
LELLVNGVGVGVYISEMTYKNKINYKKYKIKNEVMEMTYNKKNTKIKKNTIIKISKNLYI